MHRGYRQTGQTDGQRSDSIWRTVLRTVAQKNYTIDFQGAVTLDGAYDGGEAFQVGLQGHVTCCSGRYVCSSE